MSSMSKEEVKKLNQLLLNTRVSEVLSQSTKKLYGIKNPEDLDNVDLNQLLLTELIFQVKDLNINFEAIHDEIWDSNQRRDD
jgi:hypothetical protein